MSSLYQLNYDRMEFYEASGSWTCPADVTEIMLIASGGGGGGGGGSSSSGPTGGSNGTAGGNTTFAGDGVSTQTFTGGTAGSGATASAGGGAGGFGTGGIGNGYGSTTNIGANPGGKSKRPILQNLNLIAFLGGDGGDVYFLSATNLHARSGEPGQLLNGGAGGNNGAMPGAGTTNRAGSGASGGMAIGQFKKLKVSPNAVYTITIGSGGAGGGGASAGAGTGGGGGGGGAGGFVIIAYNQQAQN